MTPPARRRYAVLCLAGLALAWPAAASAKGRRPEHRTDLPPAFAAMVCAGEVGALPFQAWAAGVHDAQLEGRFLARADGLPMDAARLEHAARTLAQLRGAAGYGFGLCTGGRGWALALPAPVPLAAAAHGRLGLPVAELTARCESWRADFAPREHGAPKPLTVERGGVATAGLGDGVVSVTCQPRGPRWRGPLLWYLYPVGKGPAPEAPFLEALTETGAAAAEADDSTAVLGAWLNQVRASEGLSAAVVSAALSAEASLLAVDGSLTHDRLLLKRSADHLAAAQVRLLGEDRVKGRDARTMAWLLWNSPRHRELLLAPGASAAGLAARRVGDEQLVVLVLGRATPLQTAKATPPSKKVKARATPF